jgi:hypothetical protein
METGSFSAISASTETSRKLALAEIEAGIVPDSSARSVPARLSKPNWLFEFLR